MKLGIIFSLFIFVLSCNNSQMISNEIEPSCKKHRTKQHSCYDLSNNNVCLNFFNERNSVMNITDIMLKPEFEYLKDNRGYLKKEFFEIKEDTLFIKIPNKLDVTTRTKISHQTAGMKVSLLVNEISLNEKVKFQQSFKVDEKFKFILIGNSLLLRKCI